MPIFTINFKETHYGFAEVEADNLHQARVAARTQYEEGNVHWGKVEVQLMNNRGAKTPSQ